MWPDGSIPFSFGCSCESGWDGFLIGKGHTLYQCFFTVISTVNGENNDDERQCLYSIRISPWLLSYIYSWAFSSPSQPLPGHKISKESKSLVEYRITDGYFLHLSAPSLGVLSCHQCTLSIREPSITTIEKVAVIFTSQSNMAAVPLPRPVCQALSKADQASIDFAASCFFSVCVFFLLSGPFFLFFRLLLFRRRW